MHILGPRHLGSVSLVLLSILQSRDKRRTLRKSSWTVLVGIIAFSVRQHMKIRRSRWVEHLVGRSYVDFQLVEGNDIVERFDLVQLGVGNEVIVECRRAFGEKFELLCGEVGDAAHLADDGVDAWVNFGWNWWIVCFLGSQEAKMRFWVRNSVKFWELQTHPLSRSESNFTSTCWCILGRLKGLTLFELTFRSGMKRRFRNFNIFDSLLCSRKKHTIGGLQLARSNRL